ncbi:cobaltochelatase subunit CobN [Aquimarina rhabdastrellae]
MKKNTFIKIILALLLIVLGGYFWYQSQITTIGLINFRDSQMAEIVKANNNRFIKTVQIDPKTNDFSELTSYPVIYLFHISILTEEQRNNLKKAMDNGSKVHVLLATSKENDFSNITGDDLKYIKDCFDNEGVANIKRFLNYSRKVFDNRSLFVEDITPPKVFPKDLFFRIGTADYFETPEAYWDYYKKQGLYKEGKPKIVIMSANSGSQSQFRSYMDKMILNLEQRGFNVVALEGFKKKLANLKKLQPDMVINFPHGRISFGEEAVDWLKQENILYLTPQLVYQKEEAWKNDQQGISGGIMGQNIVVPELDGAIHPFAVAAEYINESGYHSYQPIPGRIERFCETAERWLNLRAKQNADKKLVIYYYKGNGKNALVAGGLEVGNSIFSVLHHLKKEGYNLGDLSDDFDHFMNRIHTEGPLLGDYALGTLNNFVKTGSPELIPTATYESWLSSELHPDSYKQVVDSYGKAPGTYMVTQKNNTPHLVIPRVQFGNVVLMPVLAAALGENEFKLAHGVPKAPPHAYIASYLWARKGFNADVVAHFGAHGSVEFTPWKQLLLSLKDWPEALIAPVPHLYVYSIDNIGEAMMAKRRTYATMLSHLTPPYSDAQLYGDLKNISEVLHKYGEVQNPAIKAQLKKQILTVIDSLSLDKDLELSKEQITALDKETIADIHHYLHEVEREKIIMGLHTYGVSQTPEERNETVRMMAIDPIASSLEELATLQHKVIKPKKKKHHHKHSHDHKHKVHEKTYHSLDEIASDDYEAQASFMIKKILLENEEPLHFFGQEREQLLQELEKTYGSLEESPISAYYGGSYARKKKEKKKKAKDSKEELVYDIKTHKMVPKSSLQKEEMTLKKAEGLFVHLSANRKTAKGINHLMSPEGFNELSGLLDNKSFKQFETTANFNKDVAWKVQVLKDKYFKQLLEFIQDSTQKVTVLALANDNAIQKRIESYHSKIDQGIIKKANENDRLQSFLNLYKISEEALSKQLKLDEKATVLAQQKTLDFYLENIDAITETTLEGQNDLFAVQAILKSTKGTEILQRKKQLIAKQWVRIQTKEKQILAALLQLRENLLDIPNYREGINSSPSLELDAFVNGMNGGYIAPSSGGDPVSNPLAVPTGKNLYSINEQVTPTKEAFEAGQILAQQVLQKHIAKHGQYPKKIAYSLWGGEFIRNQGLNIGQIFYMLGVEPVRNSYGRVHDVKLIPIEELKRPRIDVLVQTSGQFRDLAASRINLIHKAIQIAADAEDNGAYENYVKEGSALAERQMKEKGFSPEEAQKFSKIRVFGGLNGNYGTAIMGLVEQGDKWETEEEIAATYTKNMGAMYADGNWASYKEGLFETMMTNTEIVMHPRSSNETGPISLDHVYEFMGGLTASIRVATGKDPDGYFNDYRNRYNPKVQGLKEAIWTETRTNLFNPKYIKAQMQEGESAAEGFAENFRDTYGWNVMKPDAIDKEIWEGYYDIYVKDKQELGTIEFFKNTNPYALQEMTAVMLETIRKGYWKPNETVVKDIAQMHASLIKDHKAGCSGFVCDNTKLKEMITELLAGSSLQEIYTREIATVREGDAQNQETEEGMVLEKEQITLDNITQLIKENLSTLILLILLLGGAITWGVIKRKKEHED